MSLPIWMFWEGPRPGYIELCIETVRRHHPDVRLLDRAGFDALWTEERDLPIDSLALNHLSDFVRTYLLSRFGGLYLDADAVLMHALDPLLKAVEVHGFVGYREPQGYMSCNFMASRPGDWVIMDHWRRVAARLRDPRPLEWLDLASTPMEIAIRDYGADALILPTRSIMPVAWNESAQLAVRRNDADHEQAFEDRSWVWMLSNNTIRGELGTRHLYYLPRDLLLADRSFLAFLLRKALGHPPLEIEVPPGGTAGHLGGHEDLTQFDEGAFDWLAEHLGVESVLDIGCGPGGMAAYALSRGIAARGVDGDPGHARGSTFIIEHDYSTGPLDAGRFDLGWAVEFVEHVDEQYVPNFMASFAGCRAVFITAAVPGQPGHHHVNCQWGDYWIARFDEAGFDHDPEATEGVRAASTMRSRFTQNTGLVFRRRD
ncbi:glycosyltransferase [Sphingomonas sp. dw_22]|uniref:glycosyltransferase n=1 Tax=Sphingomonas sp. dw_22 TaxID=2721175 RepID=UPI001BD2AD22|nr:glycosyltransferase [Sphingomonas sp. dw_22]